MLPKSIENRLEIPLKVSKIGQECRRGTPLNQPCVLAALHELAVPLVVVLLLLLELDPPDPMLGQL